MSGETQAIRSIQDIAAIEAVPWEDWAGAASTLGLLERAAATWPDAAALRYAERGDDPDASVTWTHAELDGRVRRAAALFRSLGVERGDAVALLLPHVPSAHSALWGAQRAGCALPVNYLLDAAHVAALLRAANAKVVVTLGEAPAPLEGILPTARRAAELAGCVRHLLVVDADERHPAPGSFQARLAACAEADAPSAPGPDDLAALYHTGGTTGLPRLLRHSHRNEVHTGRAASDFYDFRAGDVMLNGFPLFHVAGAFVYGLSALAAGGSLLLPTLAGMRNTEFVRRAWDFAERHGVTHLGCVPTVLAALLGTPRAPGRAPSLRLALTGGSPLPDGLAARFEETTGLPVRNIFGMTECAGIVSIEPAHLPRVPGSVGLRLPSTEVVAVPPDAAAGGPLARRRAPGETGVIALRGPHVSAGYLDARQDAGTFTPDGWLLSGDLGHVDADGRVFLSGRAKDLIIRSGHNIDPVLIEEAFVSHPAVANAAAVGEPDAYAGELPVVFVTLRPGAAIDADALRAQVTPLIPEPPAVPRRVVILEQLPLTAVGKVYKPALRLRAACTKLAELAAAEAPGARVRATLREDGERRVPTLEVDVTEPPDVAARLRAMVAGLTIAVDVAIVNDSTSSGGDA